MSIGYGKEIDEREENISYTTKRHYGKRVSLTLCPYTCQDNKNRNMCNMLGWHNDDRLEAEKKVIRDNLNGLKGQSYAI